MNFFKEKLFQRIFLISVILCACLASNPGYSQNSGEKNFDKYNCLNSCGKIPEDFRSLYAQKLEKDVQEFILDSDKKETKKVKEDFILSSNYFLEELLLSGRVLFGDTVTRYVNDVAKKVFKNHPEILKNIRFYTLKTSSVNAMSTDQGIIFICMGLMTKVESEAELAFILAHEVGHYIKKHNMDSYLNKYEILKGKGEYKGSTYDKKIDLMCKHNKEHEFEADSLGAAFLADTDYDLSAINSAFNFLNYSYLPYEEVKFDQNFFNRDNFKIPSCYFKDTLNPIYKDENYDDEEDTHPNMGKRKKAVEKLTKNSKSDKRFLISKERFERVRKHARFECIQLDLLRRDYPKAIYNSYVLLKQYPENEYLLTSIAKGLYGLSKYKTFEEFHKTGSAYTKVQGESQQVSYMLRMLTKQQLNVLAIKYIRSLAGKYTENALLKRMEEDLISDLVIANKVHLKDFYRSESEIKPFDLSPTNFKESNPEKIKILQQKASERFFYSAFIDEFSDAEFVTLFNEAERKAIEIEDEKKRPYKEREKAKEEKEKKIQKEGADLNIKKLIILDPYYLITHKEKGIQYAKSEEKKLEVNEVINSICTLEGIKTYVADYKLLKDSETDKYNNLALLYEWMQEKIAHENFEVIPVVNKALSESDNLFSPYFCYVGVTKSLYPMKASYFFGVFDINSGKMVYNNYYETGSLTVKQIETLLKKDLFIISH